MIVAIKLEEIFDQPSEAACAFASVNQNLFQSAFVTRFKLADSVQLLAFRSLRFSLGIISGLLIEPMILAELLVCILIGECE